MVQIQYKKKERSTRRSKRTRKGGVQGLVTASVTNIKKTNKYIAGKHLI